jgi:MFS family permease
MVTALRRFLTGYVGRAAPLTCTRSSVATPNAAGEQIEWTTRLCPRDEPAWFHRGFEVCMRSHREPDQDLTRRSIACRDSAVRAAIAQRFAAAAGGLPAVFWTMWWGLIVNRLASFVIAFLSLYLVRERGMPPAEAGRVLAMYGIGFTVAGPLGGLLADRIGRRTTMIAGLLFGAASVGALAFARAPALLALFTFLAAATGDMYRPAMSAAVADVVPPPDRPRAYGLVYWAVNLALSVGLVLGGLVADRSFVALFIADAGTSVAAAAIVFFRVPETRPRQLVHEPAIRGLLKVFRDGPFLSFLVLHLAGLAVFVQWQLALPVDMSAHGLGPSAYAYLMAVNCAGVVFLQPILSPRLNRFDPAPLLAISAALFGVGYGINALGGSLVVYSVGTAFWTVGEVVGFPVASTMVANLAPVELRGRYQGAFAMCWGIAFTIAPLAAGETIQRLGSRALWLLCLAVALAVSVGHLATAGPRRKRLAELKLEPSASEPSPAILPS